jgi:hypothetical protein
VRLLAVAPRLDVASRRQHDRVDRVERGVDRVTELRQRHRQTAGQQQRPVHADAAVVAEVVQARRDTDQRRLAYLTATRSGSGHSRLTPLEIALNIFVQPNSFALQQRPEE